MDFGRLIATASLIALVAGLVLVKGVNNRVEIDHSYSYRPSSAAEADAYGVLDQTVPFSGAHVQGDSLGVVHAGEAWVYHKPHVEYRWLLRRTLIVEDTLHLCFTLDSPGPVIRGRLRRDRLNWWVDEATGARFSRSDGLDRSMVFCRPTDDTVQPPLRVYLVIRDSLQAAVTEVIGFLRYPLGQKLFVRSTSGA